MVQSVSVSDGIVSAVMASLITTPSPTDEYRLPVSVFPSASVAVAELSTEAGPWLAAPSR